MEKIREFKAAIMLKFGSQVAAARELGIRENRLSYIVQGHVYPTETELKTLRTALGRSCVSRLFAKGTGQASEDPARAAS